MAPGGVPPRDSIGEAITAERAVGIQSPKPLIPGHLHTRTNSRNWTEAHGLLHSPRNLFEYDATTTFRFPDVPSIDNPNKEAKKPIHVPPWASVPESLGKGGKERLKSLLLDGVLIGISIPFFILAGVVIAVDGGNIESHQFNAIEQCIKCVSSDLNHRIFAVC